MEENNKEAEIEITIAINPKSKTIYIGEENSSGCDYDYKEIQDIAEVFEDYLCNYVKERINEEEREQ